MNIQLPLNQRIDKTKLERHPSGDGWLVPTRENGKAWVLSFSGKGAKPIIGDEINYYPDGKYSKTEEDEDLMLDAYIDAYIDPYAELKAAHAAGKVIQVKFTNSDWSDAKGAKTTDWPRIWNLPPDRYRIKPDWTLADHMRRFFPNWDEATMPLHRDDFTEDMLPDGWRPQMEGERQEKGDEFLDVDGAWRADVIIGSTSHSFQGHRRTRRPLPEVKKPVPLGPEDVPPGSVIRSKGINGWGAILAVNKSGIWTISQETREVEGPYSFAEIMKDEISRDGGKTWEACSK